MNANPQRSVNGELTHLSMAGLFPGFRAVAQQLVCRRAPWCETCDDRVDSFAMSEWRSSDHEHRPFVRVVARCHGATQEFDLPAPDFQRLAPEEWWQQFEQSIPGRVFPRPWRGFAAYTRRPKPADGRRL